MKEQTNRPRFNMVSAFITMLGIKTMLSNDDNEETNSGFKYGGLGKFTGAPIYTPKRGKHKGYMSQNNIKLKEHET